MGSDPRPEPPTRPLSPEEGGGPPIGYAWTLEVAGDEGWSSDLEHAAPLPRVGERIEFVGEDGRRLFYRVTEIVHMVQTSSSVRPLVRDESATPSSIVTEGADDDPPRALRAGLPRVIVTEEEP